MKPRAELEQLITTARKLLKDPLKDKLSINEVVFYGELKTDITMAGQAMLKNSKPMIQHYIDKLKLHIGGPDATTQEEVNG